MGRRVLVVVNRSKPRVDEAVERVRRVIEKHAVFVTDCDAFSDEPPQNLSETDLILVLGGDGTLLAQARRFVGFGLPLIGVNMGTLGFLAEFDLDAFERQAPLLLAAQTPLSTHERMLIEVATHNNGPHSPAHTDVALNDAVITAGPPYRMIELALTIDGVDAARIKGDGVVVSTPVGSTGYSVSAGGAIISPDLQAMSVTPIAAHSLAFRPLVVPGNSTIEIRVIRANQLRTPNGLPKGAHGTTLVLDGQRLHDLAVGDRVVLRRHQRPVRLVKNPEGSYWKTLVRKMHWGLAPGEEGKNAR